MIFLKRISLISLFISLFTLPVFCVAKELSLQVKLTAIESIATTEERGDELYFSVTEFPTNEKPRHYEVPDFPTHWLSKYLNKLDEVVLWEKVVAEDQGVSVVFSLIERDAPPWNLDDLVGSVKLKLKNENGKLTKQWSIPNKEDTEKLNDSENMFILTGDGGEYHIVLEVKE